MMSDLPDLVASAMLTLSPGFARKSSMLGMESPTLTYGAQCQSVRPWLQANTQELTMLAGVEWKYLDREGN